MYGEVQTLWDDVLGRDELVFISSSVPTRRDRLSRLRRLCATLISFFRFVTLEKLSGLRGLIELTVLT